MKNCPNCGFCLTAPKKAKPAPNVIERDGKTYYGKLVNFSTGARVAYQSWPDDGKPRSISKALKMIIASRARGDFRPFVPSFNLAEYIERARVAKRLGQNRAGVRRSDDA